jgi:hypothetical protein
VKERAHLVNTRVALIHAYNQLIDALGRLGASGSEQAAMVWDYMPAAAPVGSPTTLRRAWIVANGIKTPLDAAVEWNAYLTCLAEFKAAALFGPAPMPIPEGCFAALDNGREWHFRKG